MPQGLQRLREEIDEQPEVLSRLVRAPPPELNLLARSLQASRPRAIVLVARGSSDHAATYGRYLFEVRNRVLTSLAAPSVLTLYGTAPDLRDTLVIAVSQSGRGEDVTAVLEDARAQGARTAAIVNDRGSPLAAAAEWVLDCDAGPEQSVPATKTVTAQMLVLALVSAAWRGDDLCAFSTLGEDVGNALRREEEARALAAHLAHLDEVSVVGRGFAYPVALELALKLKEMARLHAEAFSSADFLHGPIALVGPTSRVLVLDAGEASSGHALEIARAIERRSTEAYLVRAGRFQGFRDAPALAHAADIDEHLAPIVLLALAQRLALEAAAARGRDPANPPGLAKVTSTR
jgi:glucosamine--fructose-6-phosphate aminotransferase (isomerizing)